MILWLLAACGAGVPPQVVEPPSVVAVVVEQARQAWPAAGAQLDPVAVVLPARWLPPVVFLDPGHGAEGNTGNTGAFCQREQDFTLALSEELEAALVATGGFQVVMARRGAEPVGYRERVAAAAASDARIYLSLHSDARFADEIGRWSPEPGKECPRARGEVGVSTLYSDEGPGAKARLALGQAMQRRLVSVGFPAYRGAGYRDLYAEDADVAGVFVDRHAAGQRIFVLRAPTMPSVIIETHEAIDDREAARWEEPATRKAFFSAVIMGLVDVLSEEG
jgi:N-acetylmuramoyl-L-alanine amidase